MNAWAIMYEVEAWVVESGENWRKSKTLAQKDNASLVNIKNVTYIKNPIRKKHHSEKSFIKNTLAEETS